MTFRALGNGDNSPANIALYAFGLGIWFGIGSISIVVFPQHQWLGLFTLCLTCFHWMEYMITALYNQAKLELGCKYRISFSIYLFLLFQGYGKKSCKLTNFQFSHSTSISKFDFAFWEQ
jgi:hypothetical protein